MNHHFIYYYLKNESFALYQASFFKIEIKFLNNSCNVSISLNWRFGNLLRFQPQRGRRRKLRAWDRERGHSETNPTNQTLDLPSSLPKGLCDLKRMVRIVMWVSESINQEVLRSKRVCVRGIWEDIKKVRQFLWAGWTSHTTSPPSSAAVVLMPSATRVLHCKIEPDWKIRNGRRLNQI